MANLNDIETKVQTIIDILTCDTSTGTLPLTFISKEGNVFNWTIYGNAEGVGVRTKNLLEIAVESGTYTTGGANLTYTVDKIAGTITINGTTRTDETIGYINIMSNDTLDGNYYISGGYDNNCFLSVYDSTASDYVKKWDGTTRSDESTGYYDSQEILIPQGHTCRYRARFRPNKYFDNVIIKPMVRRSVENDSFIPYGYEVPITVSQTGQTDKNYDIFIGNSPLTEGETVTKSSTGVDIELFEGENTVSTTLTNKPEMTIKYKK